MPRSPSRSHRQFGHSPRDTQFARVPASPALKIEDGGRRKPAVVSFRWLLCGYPSLKNLRIIRKNTQCTSVRDRGVGGSNPLAPTISIEKLRKNAKFSRAGRSVSVRQSGLENRVLGASNTSGLVNCSRISGNGQWRLVHSVPLARKKSYPDGYPKARLILLHKRASAAWIACLIRRPMTGSRPVDPPLFCGRCDARARRRHAFRFRRRSGSFASNSLLVRAGVPRRWHLGMVAGRSRVRGINSMIPMSTAPARSR
jgi:hypothetical protein